MPYMFVRLSLNSFDQWKAVWDSAEQVQIREAFGCKSARILRERGGSNEVVILTEWDDFEQATEWGISDELRELMHHTGGSGQPDVLFVNDVT